MERNVKQHLKDVNMSIKSSIKNAVEPIYDFAIRYLETFVNLAKEVSIVFFDINYISRNKSIKIETELLFLNNTVKVTEIRHSVILNIFFSLIFIIILINCGILNFLRRSWNDFIKFGFQFSVNNLNIIFNS